MRALTLLSGLLITTAIACGDDGGDDPVDANDNTVDTAVATIDAPAQATDAPADTTDATPPAIDATPAVLDAAIVLDATPPDAAIVLDAAPPDAMIPPDALMLDGGPGCVDQLISSAIDATDVIFNRPFTSNADGSGCNPSGTGTAVYHEVHTFDLVGAGPHDLTSSTCNDGMGITSATFDSVIAVYQAAGGAPDAFDPMAPCTNIVGYNDDDTTNCTGNSSLLTTTGLEEGEVTVVLTTFSNAATGDYDLLLSSPSCNALP